jgi:hypothetical protein
MLPTVWLLASVAIALAALSVGIWCLVRYARTRRRPFLVVGLVLTVGLGVLLLLALVVGALLSTIIVYAPPPTLNP